MDQNKQEQVESTKQSMEKCIYFHENKKRRCHINIYKQGFKYCIFHFPKDQLSLIPDIEMIDCPLDPSHQVKKIKLERHLKICNKLKMSVELKQSPFFQEKINRQDDQELQQPKKTKILQNLYKEQSPIIYELIQSIPLYFGKAIKIYQEFLIQNDKYDIDKNIESYILDEVDVQQNQINDISKNEKDLQQVQKLVDLIQQHDLLKKVYSFIEYGAGKGRLSHEVATVLQKNNSTQSCHILIDREPRRQKFDHFHRENKYFKRLRMDIQDFNLDQLKNDLPLEYFQTMQIEQLSYVGICKHMCGSGTDLTINSLLRESNQIFRGLICATCCHHLCDTSTYVNVKFLDLIGITQDLREIFFASSSWYVSGTTILDQINEQLDYDQNKIINPIQRKRLGKMVKRILDIGRLLYICEKSKLKGKLMKYCEQYLSPENFALVIF